MNWGKKLTQGFYFPQNLMQITYNVKVMLTMLDLGRWLYVNMKTEANTTTVCLINL